MRGFTLMELLVVLFIISLISALAMPRLSTMFASVDAAFARDDVMAQINALGYKAQRQGHGFVLQQYPPAKSEEDEEVLDESFIEPDEQETQSSKRHHPEVPLKLPDGWRINSAKPVRYFSNGACSGGELLLSFKATQYRLELPPPFCQARFDS